MRFSLTILLFSISLISCQKEEITYYPQEPAVCNSVALIDSQTIFVGTWQWYKTSVIEQQPGLPATLVYLTPQTEGYTYYAEIGLDGTYRGYKNDTLVHDIKLSNKYYEGVSIGNYYAVEFYINCSQEYNDKILFGNYLPNPTQDSIDISRYPFLSLSYIGNYQTADRNYFVKVP